MLRSFAIGLFVVALAPSGLAQRTWIVDGAMAPGYHFKSIVPAVAAANPGDTLVIRSGLYVEAPIIDKGLVVLGDGAVRIAQSLAVRGVPAAGVFAMRDVEIARLAMRDCLGVVTVRRCYVGDSSLGSPGVTDLQNLARLQISESTVGDARVTGSVGSLMRCEVERLRLRGSDLTLDRCNVGSNGVSPTPPIDMTGGGGRLRIGRVALGADALSVSVAGIGDVRLDSGALVAGSIAPPVVNEDVVALFVGLVPATSTLEFELYASAGSNYVNLLSLPSPTLQFTPFDGADLWIDVPTHVVLTGGLVSGGRTASNSFPMTPLPLGFAAVAQTVTLNPQLRLSNGVALVFP